MSAKFSILSTQMPNLQGEETCLEVLESCSTASMFYSKAVTYATSTLKMYHANEARSCSFHYGSSYEDNRIIAKILLQLQNNDPKYYHKD